MVCPGDEADEGNKKQAVRSKKQVEKCKTALSFRTPVRNSYKTDLKQVQDDVFRMT
jgi:hypothetical protein